MAMSPKKDDNSAPAPGGFVFNAGAAGAAGGKTDAKRIEHAKKRKKEGGKFEKTPTFGHDSGDVFVFGSGECDQLGMDEVYEKKKPALLKDLQDKSMVQVACGGLHTLVLTRSGDVYSWGCNDDGALGRTAKDANGGPENVPHKINFFCQSAELPIDGRQMGTIVYVGGGDWQKNSLSIHLENCDLIVFAS